MLKLVEIESEMMSIKKIVCIDVMKLDIRTTTQTFCNFGQNNKRIVNIFNIWFLTSDIFYFVL